jgi:hypothetical protein
LSAELEQLRQYAESLFPGASLFLAVVQGDRLEATATISHDMHRTLMREMVFNFQREKDVVITTLVVPKEAPHDEEKKEPNPELGAAPQSGRRPRSRRRGT